MRRTPLALVLPSLALMSCIQSRSSLHAAGTPAKVLEALGWPLVLFYGATAVVMWGLILFVALRRTGSFVEHAPVTAGGGFSWVLVGGFIVPGVAFVATYVATLGVMDVFPMDHERSAPAEIRVVGHQWWWEVEYRIGPETEHFTTANEIHIPTGRPVEIELVSNDVIHSFWVPRVHGKVDLIPGIDNHIRVEVDQPGVFPGECAEFCGLEHARMRLYLVADGPARFQEWLAQQRAPSLPPRDAVAQRGRGVFMDGPCVVCHTVRGTDALGTVGPDLTHFGSRFTVAGGWLPNDLASLHAWVTNAQSVKPGARMPTLTMFRGDELHALAAYLESLH